MVLTGSKFFVFLICALLLYYVLPKKYSYISLFLCSIYFLFFNNFTIFNLLFVALLLGITYGGGIQIDKYQQSKDKKKTKIYFIGSISLILLIVGYLKYTNMFISIINTFLTNKINYINTNPPLGLSYISLIMIGYLIDTYWGITKAQRNPVKLGLFLTYFPILTSGPFIKYNDTEKGLYNRKKFNLEVFLNGLLRILLGSFKILIISTRIGLYVDGVYNNLSVYSGFLVILAILLYVFQLYANFSGTIDIVIGVSNMFGIELPENFNKPLYSETITEFWRRWHITLGTWLKNYIFYPVMKSEFMQKMSKKYKYKHPKAKRIPMYISLLIVWFLIGLWHGGKLTFIIGSGLLQCLYIVIEDLYDSVNSKRDPYFKIFRIIRTYLLFAFAMIFFRATSLSNAFDIIGNIFKNGSFDIFSTGLSMINGVILAISLLGLCIFDYYIDEVKSFFRGTSNVMRLGFILGLILIILLFGIYGIGFNVTDFIYSKF